MAKPSPSKPRGPRPLAGDLPTASAGQPKLVQRKTKTGQLMPPHRIFAPDIEGLGRAALLSGILCRLHGYKKDTKLRALQDCVLFLQAHKLGLVALTANVGDYDILLIPTGARVILPAEIRPLPNWHPDTSGHPSDSCGPNV